MSIEFSKPADRSQIISLTQSVGTFTAEEVDTVRELFDAYLRSAAASGYHFLSYCEADRVLGFACWGPTDLSRGAADLYWIVTAPQAQQHGVASQLFRTVEMAVRNIDRWLIVIWTGGRPAYEPARRFYQHMGCVLAAQIPDFYDRGDDLYVYTRRLV